MARHRRISDAILELPGRFDPTVERARWQTFCMLLPVQAAMHCWLPGRQEGYVESTIHAATMVCGTLLLISVALVHRRRTRTLGLRVAAIATAARHAASWPAVANHAYLESLLLAVFAVFPHGEAEPTMALCRWIAVFGYFWAGLQKLWYGSYWNGQMMGYLLATEPRFGSTLGLLLNSKERARFNRIGRRPVLGSGPFTSSSTLLLLASRASACGEMLLGLGLLIPRVRGAFALISILLLIAIEIGAREFVFGVLFASLLLLFFRRNFTTPTYPLVLGAYLLLLVVRMIWPAWVFN